MWITHLFITSLVHVGFKSLRASLTYERLGADLEVEAIVFAVRVAVIEFHLNVNTQTAGVEDLGPYLGPFYGWKNQFNYVTNWVGELKSVTKANAEVDRRPFLL